MSDISKLVGRTFRSHLRDDCTKVRQLAGYLLGRPLETPEYCISDTRKIIYLVNSKVACTSIKGAILERDGVRPGAGNDYDVHWLARQRKFTRFGLKAKAPGYIAFTMVRNPYVRLLSLYLNKFRDFPKIEQTGFEYENYLGGIFRLEDSFERFVNKVCRIPDRYADRHFVGQSHWLAVRNRITLDFIGKIEDAEDFRRLQNQTGLVVSSKMNAGRPYSLREFYTPALIGKVACRYARDLEYFSYDYPVAG